MPINMYISTTSAPCRVVRHVAAAINLELNLIPVDLMQAENIDQSFLKVNPQQTVPTVVDKGFVLTEQNTIARYFVNKYAPDSPLYPVDAKKRAIIDQRLDFNLGTLYPRFGSYFFPMLAGTGETSTAAVNKLNEALGFLNIFLENEEYLAGSVMSIADLAVVTSVANIDALEVTFNKFPNIVRWYEDMKLNALGFEEINREGLEELKYVVTELKMKFDHEED